LLLTSNLSAEHKKMSLAGVNIARALAFVEDCCCFHYAANAIEAPLASSHRAVRGFKRLVSTQEDLNLVEKEQPHAGTIDF
jgi:hypothetical protein